MRKYKSEGSYRYQDLNSNISVAEQNPTVKPFQLIQNQPNKQVNNKLHSQIKNLIKRIILVFFITVGCYLILIVFAFVVIDWNTEIISPQVSQCFAKYKQYKCEKTSDNPNCQRLTKCIFQTNGGEKIDGYFLNLATKIWMIIGPFTGIIFKIIDFCYRKKKQK